MVKRLVNTSELELTTAKLLEYHADFKIGIKKSIEETQLTMLNNNENKDNTVINTTDSNVVINENTDIIVIDVDEIPKTEPEKAGNNNKLMI